MGLDLVTAPAAEPITLDQAKAQLRITFDQQDDLIRSHIKDARCRCEDHTGRAIITQTWKLTLDRWPCRPNECGANRYAIFLPRPPVQSVTSVKYYDTVGVQQTLVSGTDYITQISDPVTRICPYPGTPWPTVKTDYPGAIEVVFVCGYGTVTLDEENNEVPPANIPGGLVRGMKMLLTHFHENPSEEVIGTITSQHSLAADKLFDAHSVSLLGSLN